MTGKTQSDAAQILRNIPVNSTVEILVSRQVLSDEDFESSDMVLVFKIYSSLRECSLFQRVIFIIMLSCD